MPIGNIIAGGFQSVGEGQSKKRSERPVPIGNIIVGGFQSVGEGQSKKGLKDQCRKAI